MRGRRLVHAGVALAGLAATVAGTAGCSDSSSAATPASHRLAGTLRIDAGTCGTSRTAKPASGSYLVVASAAADKLIPNRDSRCADKHYTLLQPGTEGGIRLGGFQPPASPAFDRSGGGIGASIARPVDFDGHTLALATDPHDEQNAASGQDAFPAPQAIVTGRKLRLDLRSLVFLYGGHPGTTCAQSYGVGCWNLGSESASGSYDPATHRFVIDWFQGESFSPLGDSLAVHLTGTLVPAPDGQ